MKLIVAGSTGFVATELLRQALVHPAVTSVVALARRTTPVPDNLPADAAAKLKPVVCDDFDNYSDDVKRELAGAAACIWLLSITPSETKDMSADYVRSVCFGFPTAGIRTMAQLHDAAANTTKPFRFVHTSGCFAERDQTKSPPVFGEYLLMRGAVETNLLDFAQASGGAVEVVVVKPGHILAPGREAPPAAAAQASRDAGLVIPQIHLRSVAASMLELATGDFEKDTLFTDDMERVAQAALARQGAATTATAS